MAFATVMMKHPETGRMKDAPVGFSWTTLFFGFIPALFRGDWKWAGIQFLPSLLTLGLSNLVFMFIYNKLHMKELVKKGYQLHSVIKGDLAKVEENLGIQLPRLVTA